MAVSAGLYLATTDRTFAVDPATIPIEGAHYTGVAAVRSAMELPDDKLVNIFRIATGDIEHRIETLPAVREATVTATLPHTLTVSVVERRPILVWRTGVGAWLVDGDGRLFAPASLVDAAELGTGATGTPLPAVDDQRAGTTLTLGEVVPALDLDVARLLLTVTPELLRSGAPELFVRLEDGDGYVLDAPGAWQAVFGPYTPGLRPPTIIPRQVQCLDALLAAPEVSVSRVVLALSEVACGTYRERPGPKTTPRGGKATGNGNGRKGDAGSTPRP